MPRWKVRLAMDVYTLEVWAETEQEAALLASPQRDAVLEYHESELLSLERLPDEEEPERP